MSGRGSLIGLLLVASVASLATAQDVVKPGPAPVDKGLVAAWDFRGAEPKLVKDITGNGHDAAVRGTVSYADSPSGKAIMLDGKSYLFVKDHKDLQLPEQVTVDVWLWTDETSEKYQAVLVKDGPNYRIQVTPKLEAYFGMKGKTSAGKKARLDMGAGKMKPMAWHRVTGVWNKGVAEIYLDGKKVVSAKKDIIPNVVGNLYIGRYGKSYTFKGRIDQIRIYRIARPPQPGDEKPLAAVKPE